MIKKPWIHKIRLYGTFNETIYFDNLPEAEAYIATYERKVDSGEVDWGLSYCRFQMPMTARDFIAFLENSEAIQ